MEEKWFWHFLWIRRFYLLKQQTLLLTITNTHDTAKIGCHKTKKLFHICYTFAFLSQSMSMKTMGQRSWHWFEFFPKWKKKYFQKVTFGLLVHWTFKETSEGEEESINKLNQMKGRDPVLKHKKKMNQKNSQNHEKFHIGCVYKSWHFSFLDLFSLPCNRGKNLMSMRCSTWSVAFFECLRKWNLLNSYFWV